MLAFKISNHFSAFYNEESANLPSIFLLQLITNKLSIYARVISLPIFILILGLFIFYINLLSKTLNF